jgi:hypothetical protein
MIDNAPKQHQSSSFESHKKKEEEEAEIATTLSSTITITLQLLLLCSENFAKWNCHQLCEDPKLRFVWILAARSLALCAHTVADRKKLAEDQLLESTL